MNIDERLAEVVQEIDAMDANRQDEVTERYQRFLEAAQERGLLPEPPHEGVQATGRLTVRDLVDNGRRNDVSITEAGQSTGGISPLPSKEPDVHPPSGRGATPDR